jgi:transcriptional regulator with XRE-family HTH domain
MRQNSHYTYLYDTRGKYQNSADAKKMSQADLAKAANVHQKNISKYENDGVVPSALILKEIAKALGVSADYLLGSEKDDVIKDTTLLRFFKEIDKMPDDLKMPCLKL